ncbi:MAG: bifunctional phosphopantothenoylcysteine decarboxylase/phosphopantothenate--cysteine ligase CoaBC [Chiayiivirga sp.]|jgi:phosphopantothenoylcysteine decarboxylase/phosphopantothenate--cysteine ligase|nr:bifunctional phosphopantothenoylcysteine decarboxylase/phosphopantothenate--cysteine ligase CoaBC [Xanthomonadaceae bacterium]MDX9764721.1 bifunctional phosphopantothenoylcysteine decarboxylase/phosphopantothenate--cysteine ligase CoaBC [Chiayiivirga sp.]MEB2315956.1 bifunctional phosphopantothenoylcysteine decarboxylase/phosphopantothenate--cysteine ligase CoaBC [Xanthomonadaceae bacterium]
MSTTPQRILLGVSGGIAAYKAADLVRRLRERGAQVRVVLTENAERFVTALTFQALSGEPVRTSLWDSAAEASMGHIELARWAQRVLIAPASADLIARLAQGQADDLLTTLCLATEAPLFLAPAMNRVMWEHPAVQANLAILVERGAVLLGPDAGGQACGETGAGRMWEPAAIADAVVAPDPDPEAAAVLAGRRLLLTAGPTVEDLDPVRYLGNRSSGRMGYAVAAEAQRLGMRVTLVSGPVNLPVPAGVERIAVRSAEQMLAAVTDRVAQSDLFIATAAVADFRPREASLEKIKKRGDGGLTLELVQNPDILAEVAARQDRPFVVGFAAETHDVERYARDKLERKRLDMIAANRVGEEGSGFDADCNALTVLWPEGRHEIARADKAQVARELLAVIAQCLRNRP